MSSSSTTTTEGPSNSSSSPPPSSSSSDIPTVGLIGIAAAAVVAVATILTLIICILCPCNSNKKKKKHLYVSQYNQSPLQNPPYSPNYPSTLTGKSPHSPKAFFPLYDSDYKNEGSHSLGFSKMTFSYNQLAIATGGFSKNNLVGEGGFGCVYRGILTDERVVAVKQLRVGGGQGDKEFQAEIEIISRVHHRHLVTLVGYCISDSQRMLVYDYVPNGNLSYHLHGKGRNILPWPTRMKIALGAARGLAYLHEDCHPRIIHRDIKTSNILLDKDFNAQVSDFGLAKPTQDAMTHVTTRVVGTFGYLAPEYAASGKLTDKSDVFSFGVVLLELVTGRKPVDMKQSAGEESLVEWARPVLTRMNKESDLEHVADPFLNGAYNAKEMLRMVVVAAACIRHSAAKRPTMGQALRALEDDVALSDLHQGVKPGYSHMYTSSFASTEFDSSPYDFDIKKPQRTHIEGPDYSSEYSGGATSEYGANPLTSSSEHY